MGILGSSSERSSPYSDLRHVVQPSDPDAGPYVVQYRDILGCQEVSEPEEDVRPWWKIW